MRCCDHCAGTSKEAILGAKWWDNEMEQRTEQYWSFDPYAEEYWLPKEVTQ